MLPSLLSANAGFYDQSEGRNGLLDSLGAMSAGGLLVHTGLLLSSSLDFKRPKLGRTIDSKNAIGTELHEISARIF